LTGVKATAADESSVTQRLTVTRMMAFGIFSLAAPKKKGHGNAYVVIEGPELSGVAVIAATGSNSPGSAAFAFAADVNNTARLAEKFAEAQPRLIQSAKEQLDIAKDDSLVQQAPTAYREAVDSVPAEYREKFTDAWNARR